MKRLTNGEVNMISVIRNYNMSAEFYTLDIASTVHSDRSYSIDVGVHLPSNCKNFATVIIDLQDGSVESGEYLFTLKDQDTAITTSVQFIGLIEDNDRVDVDSADVYGDSIIFN
jgi:hypothetical protein